MNRKRLHTCGALALLAAGLASTPAAAHLPISDQASAAFLLADRSTNVDPGQIGIHVVAPGPEQAKEVAAALRQRVRLVDAAGKPVTAEVRTSLAPAGLNGEGVADIHATFRTRRPGWYALRLDDLPHGVVFFTAAGSRTSGPVALRFRLGSEPLVRRARICDKGDGWTALRIDLSEPVTAGGAPWPKAAAAAVEGGPECIPAAQRTGLETRWEEPRSHLDLACPRLPRPGWLVLTLRPGLRARGGAPLANAGVRRLAIPSRQTMDSSPDGCTDLKVD
jgi:hypothetical protein